MNTKLPPLIAAQDAQRLIHEAAVICVDARGGADAEQRYSSAHVGGAVFINLEADLSAIPQDAAHGGRHLLPDIATFARTLGNAGIGPDDHILVYDDTSAANAAARFWWMMKAVGHKRIQVVDGGLAALRATGVTIDGKPVRHTPKSEYPVSAWNLPLADLEEVNNARHQQDRLVIDVRETYRYAGEREPIDLVAGHIPGAVNLPYTLNLDENGQFKSAEALRQHFVKEFGPRPSNKVVVHCGSGVTACHTLLAMAHAGLDLPALYVGSWSEWSRNDQPIARGTQP